MEGAFISPRDRSGLAGEFGTVEKPRFKFALKVLRGALELAPKDPYGARGILKKATDWALEKVALYACAWGWLNPSEALTLDDLEPLRVSTGTAHIPIPAFCRRVTELLREIKKKHPRLSRYVEARVAELDYQAKVGTLGVHYPTPDIVDQAETLHRILLVANRAQDEERRRKAVLVMMEALASTAAIVGRILDRDSHRNAPVDANFMAPARCKSRSSEVSSVHCRLPRTPAAEVADRLWREIPGDVHQIFTVVGETQGSAYLGFWVPDVRHLNRPMPGAPEAFFSDQVAVVIADDLPEFPIPDQELEGRWRKYLCGGQKNSFKGHMFISIPVRTRATPSTRVKVGVVNVNITDQDYWPRVYSPSWISFAASQVSELAALVWQAFCVLEDVERQAGGAERPLFESLLNFETGSVISSYNPSELAEPGITSHLLPQPE